MVCINVGLVRITLTSLAFIKATGNGHQATGKRHKLKKVNVLVPLLGGVRGGL